MTMRRDGPRQAVIGTCTLAIRDIQDADVLLANGLEMIDEMAREAERQGWSPDIVVLPEHFAVPSGSNPFETGEGLGTRPRSSWTRRGASSRSHPRTGR